MAREATARKATKATAAKTETNTVDLDEEAAAAAAENAEAAAAAAEAREAQLKDLASRMGDKLTDLRNADAASAVEARLQWVEVGKLLQEGKDLFIKGNTTDEHGYGKWIEANGFREVGNAVARSAIRWLAEVHEKKPDLYALFPTTSTDGNPLRRSPRTLQYWVRDNIVAAFQDAWESNSDDIQVAVTADKGDRAAIAMKSLPNVYSHLVEALEIAAENMDKAEAKIKSSKAGERKAAMADYESKAEVFEALELRKAILDQHSDDERLNYFVGWKPKLAATPFKELSVDDAAQRIFKLLKSHEDFVAVYNALGDIVEEHQRKVEADAGEVDEASEAEADEAGEGIDADMEGDPMDDFEADDDPAEGETGEEYEDA